MSLFERIKNKRYDLQEVKKKFPPKEEGSSNNNSSNTSNTTTDEPPKTEPRKIKKKLSTRAGSFEDLTGEGKVKYPKTRKELEAKRKEYQIDPKTNQPSKEGIKRYATKAKQLKSGSNVPVKLTQADLNRAKKIWWVVNL